VIYLYSRDAIIGSADGSATLVHER
jgi:hypothetical protein